ncbi:WhiB family transcriptional regulator [uncultured Corynebacterium sp.]|uniref:WhiB family transcriptional regulator n=1 Tax=uncultured Corynebacterium sp. TaxID=159447 RepID=UPI0025ECFD94|nr:WhiB family transcriptional regulator [uncultured Corynebacterium sp.]
MTASLTRPADTSLATTKDGRIQQKVDSLTDPSSFVERGQWITHAKCRDIDPEELFVKGSKQRQAAAICRHCPVVLQCRADALDNRVEFGVWGGMTERQRRALLREHPEVESWADFYAGYAGRS